MNTQCKPKGRGQNVADVAGRVQLPAQLLRVMPRQLPQRTEQTIVVECDMRGQALDEGKGKAANAAGVGGWQRSTVPLANPVRRPLPPTPTRPGAASQEIGSSLVTVRSAAGAGTRRNLGATP